MKKDCVYRNKCYRHGSSLKLNGEDLSCNDGQWKKQEAENVKQEA